MGRKNTKTTKQEAAKSMAASFTTEWLNINSLDNVGYVINCSSVTDNTGTFAVEVKNQESTTSESGAVALTLSAVPTMANADTDFAVSLNNLPYTHVRLSFTAAGSVPDGVCDIFAKSETVGA